jgi:hypothetical protein
MGAYGRNGQLGRLHCGHKDLQKSCLHLKLKQGLSVIEHGAVCFFSMRKDEIHSIHPHHCLSMFARINT